MKLPCLLLCLLIAWPAAAQEQYKRLGLNAMVAIVDGRHDDAQDQIDAYLTAYPNDPEALFVQTVLHAQRQDPGRALETARAAVAAGLPVERLLAGPRRLLQPLTGSDAFRAWMDTLDVERLHGPHLGDLTSNRARFWLRTVHEVPVQVLVREANEAEPSHTSPVVRTDAGRDYTALLTVDGLQPGRSYHYQVSVDGRVEPETWSFRTPPAAGAPARFQVGFGGGAGYTPWYERMWTTIAARQPLAFLFMGDNVYIDNPTRPDIQRYTYYRRQARPEFQYFAASTALYAIWDDHDFSDDDSWGGPEIEEPAWKRPVWNLYRENWLNPAYGGGESQPGSWFHFTIGDVAFFMLDSRYYREDPSNEAPRSMLGPVQKAWLLDALQASTATFNVIASPVPWATGTKPGSLDTWDGYAEEREAIFAFLEEHRIDGVFLLSADRHRSDVWKIERPNGYDLYEFETSKLTNMHTHGPMPGALFSYNEKCSYGLLTFDTTRPDPGVRYEIISIDNERIHTHTLKLSQLTHTR